MLCAVYKSLRKAETYLFVNKRDDFADVPPALLAMFGTPQLVMVFPLAKRESLGIADIHRVRAELAEKGFYLQLPPPKENWLKDFRQQNGVED